MLSYKIQGCRIKCNAIVLNKRLSYKILGIEIQGDRRKYKVIVEILGNRIKYNVIVLNTRLS